MINTYHARDQSSKVSKRSSSGPDGVTGRTERKKNMKENETHNSLSSSLRTVSKGNPNFFCHDLNLNGRHRGTQSFCLSSSCSMRRGSHTANTRVEENGLYRGECVRSVLVPIGLVHQRFSKFMQR